MALNDDVLEMFTDEVGVRRSLGEDKFGKVSWSEDPIQVPANIQTSALVLYGRHQEVRDVRGKGVIWLLWDDHDNPLTLEDKYELPPPFAPGEAPIVEIAPVKDELGDICYYRAMLGYRDRG